MHRSLSQIQVKLFEYTEGLDTIISTSSIIEGVNTQAEQVIVWSNKKVHISLIILHIEILLVELVVCSNILSEKSIS